MHEANGTAKARIAYFPIISNGTVALTNDREILVWLPLETTLNAGPDVKRVCATVRRAT